MKQEQGPRLFVLLVAAGRAARAGFIRKNLRKIHGIPLFIYALQAFSRFPKLNTLVLVIPESEERLYRSAILKNSSLAARLQGKICFSAGGQERFNSVQSGLNKLSQKAQGIGGKDIVLIHDAARPLIRKSDIQDLLDCMLRPEFQKKKMAVVPAMHQRDALKSCSSQGFIRENLPRKNVMAVATPQCFPFKTLKLAINSYGRNQDEPLDEATVYHKAGFPVYCLETRHANFKVTYKEDLALAKKLLRK